MSSVVISGDTSGSVTLQAPAVSGTTVLTLPATSGTVLTTASGTAATATNLAGGSNGTIPYQSADGTTQMLAVGSSGQSLLSGGVGAPTWGTPALATSSTNLAGGSNGTIPYQSAAGTTQMLAVGTSGQVLRSNGVAAPSWVTPSAGAVTLLGTVTATAASTILVNSGFTSTYDTYDLVVYGTATVNNVSINLRYELGGSIITSGTYQFAQFYDCLVGNASNSGSEVNVLNVGNSDQAVGNNFTVTFRITNPSSTSITKLVTWQGSSIRAVGTFNEGRAANTALTALTGIQIYPASGTVTGVARLYGYAKT